MTANADAFGRLAAAMESFGSQAPFACALGLTKTAQDVQAAIVDEMSKVFDRPTPYTMSGWRVWPATKRNLEASVRFREASGRGTSAHDYLGPEVFGGERRYKGIEVALRALSIHNLPPGWYVVPGPGARIDSYGNVSRGQIIQILSQLRITLTAGHTRNMSFDPRKKARALKRAGGQYFILKPGESKSPGVYQRELSARKVTPVLLFVSSVSYQSRLDVKTIAQRTIDARFVPNMHEAMAQTIATAYNTHQPPRSLRR